jgi:hypothetical protein
LVSLASAMPLARRAQYSPKSNATKATFIDASPFSAPDEPALAANSVSG